MKWNGEMVEIEINDDRTMCRFVTTELPLQKVSEWFPVGGKVEK